MPNFNSNSYPIMGKQIDSWDRHSKYLVKIIAQEDQSIAFHQYSIDFYNAAHIITDYLLSAQHPNISQLDTYFFAVAFLYRHSIELALKAIGFKQIDNTAARSAFIKSTFHNLAEYLMLS